MRGLIALATILLLGCGGNGTNCTAGTEGCECTPGGLCDLPNTCEGGLCVAPTDTSTDPDVPVDNITDTSADTATDDVVEEVECASDPDCDDSDPCTVDTCDMDYDVCSHSPVDADSDGYPAEEVSGTACDGGTDCDDSNPDAYPGAAQSCSAGVDMDCSGTFDKDDDGDGYTDAACPSGDDCLDTDASFHPGAVTACEDLDRDCNGCPDYDDDCDGSCVCNFGADCPASIDCDDMDPDAHPGAPAVQCSVADHDCNGESDLDNDGDGHTDVACPSGDDCFDADPARYLHECTTVDPCCDGCARINGCWYDPATSYVWEDPPSSGTVNWETAMAYCNGLSLAGHGPGAWRVPSVSNLRSSVRDCPDIVPGGACGVADWCLSTSICNWSSCGGCGAWGGADAGCYRDQSMGGDCAGYWSSSIRDGYPDQAWLVNFIYPNVDYSGKSNAYSVRCVYY